MTLPFPNWPLRGTRASPWATPPWALVWQNGNKLRLSLDRTDLWDLRPSDSLAGPNYNFAWVKEHIRSGNYLPVQKKLDWPYDAEPAPAKIPGAALEFALEKLGKPKSVRLYLDNALCEVTWPDGTQLQTFVHATEPIGWFVFRNLKDTLTPAIVPPVYNRASTDRSNDHAGQDIERLGYEQGTVSRQATALPITSRDGADFTMTWRWSGSTAAPP